MSEFYKLNKKSKIHSNGDGYITKDGHTMFQFDIVQDLNRIKALERKLNKLREAYDFNLELLSEKERQLEEDRESEIFIP